VSSPLRRRGLKYVNGVFQAGSEAVVSLAETWIEITCDNFIIPLMSVVSLAETWIEI